VVSYMTRIQWKSLFFTHHPSCMGTTNSGLKSWKDLLFLVFFCLYPFVSEGFFFVHTNYVHSFVEDDDALGTTSRNLSQNPHDFWDGLVSQPAYLCWIPINFEKGKRFIIMTSLAKEVVKTLAWMNEPWVHTLYRREN